MNPVASRCHLGGLYLLIHKPSGKIYVGQTIYFVGRLASHKRALKNGTHPNKKLQDAVREDGLNSIEFQIYSYARDNNFSSLSEETVISQFRRNGIELFNFERRKNL